MGSSGLNGSLRTVKVGDDGGGGGGGGGDDDSGGDWGSEMVGIPKMALKSDVVADDDDEKSVGELELKGGRAGLGVAWMRTWP